MYTLPSLVGKKGTRLSVPFLSAMKYIEAHPLAAYLLQQRTALLTGNTVFGSDDFWITCSDALQVALTQTTADFYNISPTRNICVFTSAKDDNTGGFESSFMEHALYGADYINIPDLEDYEHITFMIEGFLSILAIAMGYSVAYVGDEKYSGNNESTVSSRPSFEQTEQWWRLWNNYICKYGYSLQSVVGQFHKHEIIEKVYHMKNGNLNSVSSCNNWTKQKAWCGGCWKCLVTKLTLDHKNLPNAIELDLEKIQPFVNEYIEYKKSGKDYFRSCGVIDDVGGLPKWLLKGTS